MPTVADHLIEQLDTQGVRRIYGIPGDSLNGLTDSLRENGRIEWVHHRHEEAAAFAAAAEAEITGELTVCVGSCGPGQPASDQRPVRCEPFARSGAGHRRAYPYRGDRLQLLPGDPPGGSLPWLLGLCRTGLRSQADAADAAHCDARGHREARGGRAGDFRGCGPGRDGTHADAEDHQNQPARAA